MQRSGGVSQMKASGKKLILIMFVVFFTGLLNGCNTYFRNIQAGHDKHVTLSMCECINLREDQICYKGKELVCKIKSEKTLDCRNFMDSIPGSVMPR